MSAIAATLISILQAFVFCCIGPTVLLFGPAVAKSVTVVQACLASGYLSLMNSIIAIQPDSVMVVFEGGFYMLTGALALAFAALKSETGSQMMKGMATGYLVAEPMLLLGSKALYSGVAGCTRLGNPTIEFPQVHDHTLPSLTLSQTSHTIVGPTPRPRGRRRCLHTRIQEVLDVLLYHESPSLDRYYWVGTTWHHFQ